MINVDYRKKYLKKKERYKIILYLYFVHYFLFKLICFFFFIKLEGISSYPYPYSVELLPSVL